MRFVVPICASLVLAPALLLVLAQPASAQLTDKTQTTSANAGINKSYTDEIGAGRGDVITPNSSLFIINRDPFRAIRRGRQIFQRKFTKNQGLGPRVNDDSMGDLNDPTQAGLGVGLVDSCAEHLKKGRQVFVEGRLRTREYGPKNVDGKRKRTEIVASRVQFLGAPSTEKSRCGYG